MDDETLIWCILFFVDKVLLWFFYMVRFTYIPKKDGFWVYDGEEEQGIEKANISSISSVGKIVTLPILLTESIAFELQVVWGGLSI